jgi:hypothetical protein
MTLKLAVGIDIVKWTLKYHTIFTTIESLSCAPEGI